MDSMRLGDGRAFYEFVVPAISLEHLRPSTVHRYRAAPGNVGTALAVSIFDVKGPAFFDDTAALDIREHRTLTHYLLDGNHKLHAASIASRAASVLSFITIQNSVATREEIADLVTASLSRSGPGTQ
jgi:hypothetical protein